MSQSVAQRPICERLIWRIGDVDANTTTISELVMEAAIRTAVILAAGPGLRLSSRGTAVPKGFLVFGERPIVLESALMLANAGIERVVVVTGHLAHFYEQLHATVSLRVELVHNPRYAESGTMYSLYQVREMVSEDFLLLESDLVYQPRALNDLLVSDSTNALAIADIADESDIVYVTARDRRVVEISKELAELKNEVVGQYIGIARVSLSLFRAMCGWAEKAFAVSLRYEYDQATLSALACQHEIHAVGIPGLVWAEVDTEEDYRRVATRVHPRVGYVGRQRDVPPKSE
jgi:choline kinase